MRASHNSTRSGTGKACAHWIEARCKLVGAEYEQISVLCDLTQQERLAESKLNPSSDASDASAETREVC